MASQIRVGEIVELSHALNSAMPMSEGRGWRLQPKPRKPLRGSNRRGSYEELVVAEIGQLGTHLDGLGHQTRGDFFYGGVACHEAIGGHGLKCLGIEKIGPLIGRGVLVPDLV